MYVTITVVERAELVSCAMGAIRDALQEAACDLVNEVEPPLVSDNARLVSMARDLIDELLTYMDLEVC